MRTTIAATLLLVSTASHASHTWEYTATLSGSETTLAPGSPPPFMGGNVATYQTEQLTGLYTASLTVTGSGRHLTISGYDITLALSNGTILADISDNQLLIPAYETRTGARTCAHESFGIDGCIQFAKRDSSINFKFPFAQGGQSLAGTLDHGSASFGLTSREGCVGTPYITGSDGICSISMSGDDGKWTRASAVHAPELDTTGAATGLTMLAATALVMRKRR